MNTNLSSGGRNSTDLDYRDRPLAVYRCKTANIPVEHQTLRQMVRQIRDPAPYLKEMVTKIRNATSKDERDRLKGQIKGFSLSCDANSREQGKPLPLRGIVPSGLMQLDFDLDDAQKVTVISAQLKQHQAVVAVFISPSGPGRLKAVVAVEGAGELDRHEQAFTTLDAWSKEHFEVENDPQVKDVQRLCFTSYDPDAWMREDAIVPLPLMVKATEKKPNTKATKAAVGSRNNTLFNLGCKLRHEGVEGPVIQAALEKQNSMLETPLPAKEVATIAKSAAKYEVSADGNEQHAKVVTAIITEMEIQGIAADAVGQMRRKAGWSRVNSNTSTMASKIAFDLRRTGKVSVSYVEETIAEMIRRDAEQRRQHLLRELLGKTSTDAGREAARTFLRAVTGDTSVTDYAAFLHMLWLTKMRQSGGHGHDHHMLVFYGPQDGGKTVAAQKLMDPWAELCTPVGADTLTDDRQIPTLANYAVGLWDELEGAGKADLARLKNIITARTAGYRPMRTNTRVEVPVVMTFLGTTNHPVEDVFRDSTGNRRAYQLSALPRLDWTTINSLDYSVLWTAVSELEASPMDQHRVAVRAQQAQHVHRDVVSQWLAAEDWMAVEVRDPGTGLMRQLNTMLDSDFIPADECYARLHAYCAGNGERAPTSEIMGKRLIASGWHRVQRRVAGRQRWGYLRPKALPAGDTGDSARVPEKPAFEASPVASPVTNGVPVTDPVTANTVPDSELDAVTGVTSEKASSPTNGRRMGVIP